MHLSFHFILLVTCLHLHHQLAHSNLVVSQPSQPLKPPDFTTTVPSFPAQTGAQTCKLDLSAELFGGVNAACGVGGHNNNKNLDRSRCCPVLAAWLYAAHAKTALQLKKNVTYSSSSSSNEVMPMMPDDSQKCVNSLQTSLLTRNIHIPQPNASCDAVICFCGIRLHQIGSLTCPAAFNTTTTTSAAAAANVTPTALVRNLEKNCRNSSYSGCTKCLGALQKLNGDEGKNGTVKKSDQRTSKMMKRDCQLMGLTWLLERNKTAYIATVSAVLRAIMYESASKCSPDHANMPLAVDSLQFDKTTDQFKNSASFLFLSKSCVVVVVLVMHMVGFI